MGLIMGSNVGFIGLSQPVHVTLSLILALQEVMPHTHTRSFSIRLKSAFGMLLFSLTTLTSAQTTSAKVVEHTLANGLKILVAEDKRAPTVAHMVWYKAGSIDEVNGKTGVAHVLEHMMFKGTKTIPTGEFSKRVAAMGGRENAFTSKDYTGYFQQIPKERLAAVMAL